MTTRHTIAVLTAPGVQAVRDIYTDCPVDVLRVAALVDVAGAAAALARTVVRLRHPNPAVLAVHVADPVDLRAVLGRGRWLPTMTRHIGQPSTAAVPVVTPALPVMPLRRRAGGAVSPGQLLLFPRAAAQGGDQPCR